MLPISSPKQKKEYINRWKACVLHPLFPKGEFQPSGERLKKFSLQPSQLHSAPEGEIHTASETQSSSGEEESIGAEARGGEGGSATCHNPTQEGHGEEVLFFEEHTHALDERRRQHDTVDSAHRDGGALWGRTGKVKGLSIRETRRERRAVSD